MEFKITSNAIRCKVCDEILESFHRHDFKMCKGKHVFVDGGTDYIRRGGLPEHIEDLSTYEKDTGGTSV